MRSHWQKLDLHRGFVARLSRRLSSPLSQSTLSQATTPYHLHASATSVVAGPLGLVRSSGPSKPSGSLGPGSTWGLESSRNTSINRLDALDRCVNCICTYLGIFADVTPKDYSLFLDNYSELSILLKLMASRIQWRSKPSLNPPLTRPLPLPLSIIGESSRAVVLCPPFYQALFPPRYFL